MARVFTTRFPFNHQMYDAIVTVDTELAQLLPDGHLNYSGKDGFKEIIPDNQLAETLIKSIAVSIEQHLTILP